MLNRLFYSLYCTYIYISLSLSLSFRFVLSHLPQDPPERESAPKSQTVTSMLYGNKQLKEAYQSIFTLYGGFVGSIHFGALSKLLGYHGIAMLLEQLLNVIKISVSERVGLVVL